MLLNLFWCISYLQKVLKRQNVKQFISLMYHYSLFQRLFSVLWLLNQPNSENYNCLITSKSTNKTLKMSFSEYFIFKIICYFLCHSFAIIKKGQYLNLEATLTSNSKMLDNNEKNTYISSPTQLFSFFHNIWGFVTTICVLQLEMTRIIANKVVEFYKTKVNNSYTCTQRPTPLT